MGKGEPDFNWRTLGYLLGEGRSWVGSYIRDILERDTGGRGRRGKGLLYC